MRIRSAFVVAVLSVMAWATPARASPARHCAFHLVPTGRIGAVVEARLTLVGCYRTFAEAVESGAGGGVRLSPDTSPATLTDAELALASSLLIGTEYLSTGYAGASNSYFASATCSSTTSWQVAYVGDAWNDVFSSGQGFGGCDHNKKFENSNFGGNSITCTPNCADYGALSNRVSSLRWKP